MKKCLLVIISMFAYLILNANHWEPNPYQFENNMISIGIIKFDDVEQRSESLEIGAFCDNECRGSAIAMYNSSFDRYFIFLMIYGNEGNEISFRVYDHQQQLEPDMISLSSMTFHINGQEGSADNPFEFAFESLTPTTFEITASVNPENAGEVSGTGTYVLDATCELEARTFDGYTFVNFTENGNVVSTEPLYSFQVTENHNFIANFELNQYEVSVAVNPENSAAVSGGGTYNYGETCSVSVTPFEHWHFQNWTVNGEVVSTETDYSFTVTENVTLTANLYYYDAVEENQNESLKIYPNPAKDVIFVELGERQSDIVITNSLGQVVKTVKAENSTTKIDVSDFKSGIFFVAINNKMTKVVKE